MTASVQPLFTCLLHDGRRIYPKSERQVWSGQLAAVPGRFTATSANASSPLSNPRLSLLYCEHFGAVGFVLLLSSKNLVFCHNGSDGYPAVTARRGGVLPPWSRCHLPPVCRGHLQPLGCFQVRLSFPHMIKRDITSHCMSSNCICEFNSSPPPAACLSLYEAAWRVKITTCLMA